MPPVQGAPRTHPALRQAALADGDELESVLFDTNRPVAVVPSLAIHIGPITATETGIATTDIGVPTLGMHSMRELACAADVPQMISLIEAFYRRLA